MIGAAGDCTIAGFVVQTSDGRYRSSARVARHVVSAEGTSPEAAMQALEEALARVLGPLDWVRWRQVDGR